jgi:hypothetical protein
MIRFAYTVANDPNVSKEILEVLQLGYFMIFMLCLLVVMHAYWTFFIFKGLIDSFLYRKTYESYDSPLGKKDKKLNEYRSTHSKDNLKVVQP